MKATILKRAAFSSLLLCLPALAQTAQIAIDRQTKGMLPTDRYLPYSADTGTANAYAATIPMSGGVVVGLKFSMKVANTNTGASTMALNALGTQPICIKGPSGPVAAVAGDLAATVIHEFTFNGSCYQTTTDRVSSVTVTPSARVLSSNGSGNGVAASAADTGVIAYAVDSGTANNYIGIFSPVIPALSTGTQVRLAVTNTNTAASTFQANSTTATAIRKLSPSGLTPLVAGDFVAGQVYSLIYDGTYWQTSTVSLGSASAVGPVYACQAAAAGGAFAGSANCQVDPLGNLTLGGQVIAPKVNGNFYVAGYANGCTFGSTTFTRAADCAFLDAQKYEQATGLPALVINDAQTEYFTEPIHENDTVRLSIIGATRKISALQFLNTRTNAITLLTAGGYEDDAAINYGCATASLPNPIHLSDITLGANSNAGMAVDIAASKIGSIDHVNFTGAAGTGDTVLSKAGSTNQLGNAGCANTVATVKQSGALTGMTPGVFYVASTQCTGVPPATGATGTDQAVLRFVISASNALDSLVVMHRGTGCPTNTTFTPPSGTGWNLTVNMATQGGDAEMYSNDNYWIGQGNLPKQTAELMCGISSPTAPFCNVIKYPYTATISGTSLTITSKVATSSSSSDSSGYPIPAAGASITANAVFDTSTTIATINTSFGGSYGTGTLSKPDLIDSQIATMVAGGQTYLAIVNGSNFTIIGSPSIINGSVVTGGGYPTGTTITAGSGSSFTTSNAGTSGSSVPVQIASGGVYQNVSGTNSSFTSPIIVYLNGYGPSLSGASGANDYAGMACSTNGGLNNITTGSAPHFVQIPNSAGSIATSSTWTMDTVAFTGYSGCALDRSYPGIYAFAPDLSYPAYGLHEVSITDTQFNQSVFSNIGRIAAVDNDNNGNTYIGEHPINQQVGMLDRTGAMHYGIDGDSTIYQFWLKGSTTVNGLHQYHAPCADGTNSCFGGNAPFVIDTGAQAPNGFTSISQSTLASSDYSTPPPDYHFVINVSQGPVDYNDAAYWPAGVDARNNQNMDPRQNCKENGVTVGCDIVYDWGMNMVPQSISSTGLISPIPMAAGDIATNTLSTITNLNVGSGVQTFTLPSATPGYTVASNLATVPLGTSVCTGMLINIGSVQATTGKILTASYASGGTGCNLGNYLSVTQAGSTNDSMVKVTAVSGGVPSAVAAVVAKGYSVGQSVPLGPVSSQGIGAQADITAVDADGQATAANLHVDTLLGTRTGGEYMVPDLLVPQQTGGGGAAWPLTALTVGTATVSGPVYGKTFYCNNTTCGLYSTSTVHIGNSPTAPMWNFSTAGNLSYGSGNTGGTIGLSGTPVSNAYLSALNVAGTVRLTGWQFGTGSIYAAVQGSGTTLQAAGTNSGTTNAPHCNDSSGAVTTTCTNPWLASSNVYTATQSGTTFSASVGFRGAGSASTSYGPTGLYNMTMYSQGDDRVDLSGTPTTTITLAPNKPATYNAGTTYGTGNTDNVIGPDGIKYHSIQAGNVGNTPASSPTYWTAYTVTSGSSSSPWDQTYSQGNNNSAPGTIVNCATSGTATFYPIERGTAIKRILVYQAACTGSATLTLASTAGFANFAHTPFVTGSTTVTSTTTIVTAAGGAGTSGYSEVVGN